MASPAFLKKLNILAPAVAAQPEVLDQFDRYCRLIQTWNPVVSIVSVKDAQSGLEDHLLDALSLSSFAETCQATQTAWLDIGTGGGFPAIVLKIAFPELPLICIERSDKKIGFLQKAVGHLHLSNVTLLPGEYPAVKPLQSAVDQTETYTITARAIEQPGKMVPLILEHMTPGSLFLCQSGDPTQWTANSPELFHVKQWDDAWTEKEARRGQLFVVERKS